MRSTIAMLALLGFGQAAQCGNLSLAPTNLNITAPSKASAITLTNSGKSTLKMQARVFSWGQRANGEVFQKTNYVAVSPPFVKIKSGASAVVRVVRISKQPITTEESYRLFLDEIPSAPVSKGTNVRMVMRHSVPVFFSSGNDSAPKLSLAAHNRNGRLSLIVKNRGGEHLKLWNLEVTNNRGSSVSFGKGLNGYVLAGGVNQFVAEHALKASKITVKANSNYGPVSWVARVD